MAQNILCLSVTGNIEILDAIHHNIYIQQYHLPKSNSYVTEQLLLKIQCHIQSQ